jgi:hypothetical protein
MADDEEAFDATDVMHNIIHTRTVPPPTRRPSRHQALSMLAAVVAASISANVALRSTVSISIDRQGGSARNMALWRALAPKGRLHSTMLKPATKGLRTLANAAKGTKCYMFKRDQCPPMIHPNTVFMLIPSGLLCLAYTISYVSGLVGWSRKYKKFNNGQKCKGFRGYMDFHHVASLRNLYGLCFVLNPINKLIEKIVYPRPQEEIPDKNIEDTYEANEPDVIIGNILLLKGHEDGILAGDVDCVECQHKTRTAPSTELLRSLMPDQPNFEVYLERADSAHRKLAGVSSSTKGIYQFKSTERPDFIDPACVLQVYVNKQGYKDIRVLHCRCPILGIGGTKVGGGSSGEEAKNRMWPVVLHHLGKDDLSLVVFCDTTVNKAIGFIP